MTIRKKSLAVAGLTTLAAVAFTACSSGGDGDAIRITGSATVEPVTRLAGTESRMNLEITSEGTYDGFEEFCQGNSDINNSSSAITDDLIAQCEENGVDFIELPIGLDALSVVVHTDSPVDDLSMDELAQIWSPDSDITTWNDLRSDLADEEIGLYGRPEGSGTFSYFTSQVTGEDGAIRDDYESTDDLDELTGWISEDENGLGFMGVGNYLGAPEEDRVTIKTVSIDGVEPTRENAVNGSYQPLTRPLFLYVSVESLNDENSNVAEFVEYYLDNASSILPRVYFYPLAEETYELVQQRFENRVTNESVMGGDPFATVDLDEALS